MLLLIFAIVILCATLALAWYHRLPDGGRCPRCGTRVDAAGAAAGVWQWWPLRRLVHGGRCPECGWGGPMRPGPVTKMVRVDRGQAREDR